MLTNLVPELLARVQTYEGARPAAAPVPPSGYYWIREIRAQHAYWIDRRGARLDHPTHNEIWPIYSWDAAIVSNWLLVFVDERGFITQTGDDQDYAWEDAARVTTHVSDRIDPPA